MFKPRRRRPGSDTSVTTASEMESDPFNDVVLVVEGRKVCANRAVLAYNSSVLGCLIDDAEMREESDTDWPIESPGTPRRRQRQPLEVELPNQCYKTVKTMMAYLQTKYNKGDNLSGETALQLLPLTETYKLSRLRKRCAAAMLVELESLRRAGTGGTLPLPSLLKYLAGADKYGIEKVKRFCVSECAGNHSVACRKEVVEDEHISDKTKVCILDKMCDKMNETQNKKLEDMRKEFENRYKSTEEQRQQYSDETEEWKENFQREVKDIVTTKKYKPLYEHLLDEIKENKECIDEILAEVKALGEKVSGVKEPLETIDQENPDLEKVWNELSEVKGILDKVCAEASIKITKMSDKTKEYFQKALKNFDVDIFQSSIAGSYELQLKIDNATAELEDKTKELGEIETLYEREKVQHERTKAQLYKQQKKIQQINTWIKWAKPVGDDEDRCTCYRHDVLKRPF